MKNRYTLIIGANSGIAKALAQQLMADIDHQLILISRDLNAYSSTIYNKAVKMLINDYQPATIEATVNKLIQLTPYPITQVFICHGVLHNQDIQPEKRLEDFNAQAFQYVLQVNALTPMLWLQQLPPLLTGTVSCKIVVLSARVGSINDNKLGGWYSYRASKAALNMMIKTAAIELARRAKNIKLIAFHPGTTDTPLSKPFQKNVPPDQLFTREFVAKQLLTIVDKIDPDGQASYLDWQGKSIDW